MMRWDDGDVPHAIPAGALIQLLRQLAAVVERLDDGQYRTETAAGVSGSIGAHVRHTLDHVEAFAAGAHAVEMTYDSRARGTAVERRRGAALEEIDRLIQSLRRLPGDLLDRPLTVLTELGGCMPPLSGRSSVGRELTFVIAHTVHHCAIMALLLRDLGVPVPPRFGYAASTPLAELATH